MWVLRSDFRGWISVLILAVTREHDAKDMWTGPHWGSQSRVMLMMAL